MKIKFNLSKRHFASLITAVCLTAFPSYLGINLPNSNALSATEAKNASIIAECKAGNIYMGVTYVKNGSSITGEILSSTDNKNWKVVYSCKDFTVSSIAYGDGTCIAASKNGKLLGTTDIHNPDKWQDIKYSCSHFSSDTEDDTNYSGKNKIIFNNGFFVFMHNGSPVVVIDNSLNTSVNAISTANGIGWFRIGKLGAINASGAIIAKPQFESAVSSSGGLAAFRSTGSKICIIDKTGKIIANNLDWDSESNLRSSSRENSKMLPAFVCVNRKWGYLNYTGNYIIKPTYDSIRFVNDINEFNEKFSEGLCTVQQNGKYGFIDRNGNIIIKPQFDDTNSFYGGLCQASLNGKWGLINRAGKFVVKPEFKNIFYSKDCLKSGLIPVENESNLTGYIDLKGNLKIPYKFYSTNDFTNGLAPVRLTQNGNFGYIDKTGKMVINPQFALPGNFDKNGYAIVENYVKNKPLSAWKIIDKKGKVIYSQNTDGSIHVEGFTWPIDIHDGLFKIFSSDPNNKNKNSYYGDDPYESLWGFMNTSGKIAVKPMFDCQQMTDFSCGAALAGCKNGKTYIVYKKGKTKFIGSNLQVLSTFTDNIAILLNKQKNKYEAIDTNGKIIIKPLYSMIGNPSEGLMSVRTDDKWGYADKTGKIVIPMKYAAASDFQDGKADVLEGDKWITIDKKGNITK